MSSTSEISAPDSAINVSGWLIDWLSSLGLQVNTDSLSYASAGLAIIIATGLLSWGIAKFILHFKVLRFVARTRNTWDDSLLDAGVFRRLAHLLPGIVVYSVYPLLFTPEQAMHSLIHRLSVMYLLVTIWLTLSALLCAVEDIYSRSLMAKKAPITGFVQVTRLLITLVISFLMISLFLDKSPVYLLSGLTAIAAVLLLIFRDTILGFVAGIQIAANRMFNTGDWIEIPKYGVDGEILVIGLNVVKVQNWDKTISTIPTYQLTSDAVKNWRGMSESGGRRIKRSVNIDIHSVRFANDEDIKRWQSFKLIKGYLQDKQRELEEYNLANANSEDTRPNARRLTNLGTFRAYVTRYLQAHPKVNKDMTHMVRQLNPTELGVPLEIYCFSADKDWVTYEGLQADIFDHILAIMPAFGLKAYQRVSNN